jgi:hypothetical protein
MIKKQKIKKMVVLHPEVNDLLIELSKQTKYNYSEIVEIAIKNLNTNEQKNDILKFNETIKNTIKLLSDQLLKDVI